MNSQLGTLARVRWKTKAHASIPKAGSRAFSKQARDCRIQRWILKLGQISRCFRAQLLMFGVARQKHRRHPQPPAKVNVGDRVANHHAAGRGDRWKIRNSLLEHSRQWLAAVASVVVMRAKIESVDVRVLRLQQPLKVGVNLPDVFFGIESQRNAALIRHYDHRNARAVEEADGLGHARQNLKLIPACDVAALGHLLVQHAVAVKEDGLDGDGKRTVESIAHPAMIAIERF